jgi:hypothetical protein
MKSLLVKLGVILLGLAIFAYAGKSQAECAWVLWESRGDDGYLHWQMNDAFPSYEKCKQGQRIECERWKELLSTDIQNTQIIRLADMCPDSLIISYKDSSRLREIVYKCFPDTVDPRK